MRSSCNSASPRMIQPMTGLYSASSSRRITLAARITPMQAGGSIRRM